MTWTRTFECDPEVIKKASAIWWEMKRKEKEDEDKSETGRTN